MKEVTIMASKTIRRITTYLPILIAIALLATACDLPFQPGPDDTPTPPPGPPTATVALPPPTNTPPLAPTNTPVMLETPTPTEELTPTGSPIPPTSTLAPVPPPSAPTVVTPVELLTNGSFEDGFWENGVGLGWHEFHSDKARYGWGDDSWDKVVSDGQHAQLMQISDAREGDRYIGIYQAVSAQPDAIYELAFHGVIRSSEGNPALSSHGYRIQWGVDYNGGTNWEAVKEWTDVGWDEQSLEANSYVMGIYNTTIEASSDKLTLFIRGWKKWPTYTNNGLYDIDAVSLMGKATDRMPTTGEEKQPNRMPTTGWGTTLLLTSALLGFILVLVRGAREFIAHR